MTSGFAGSPHSLFRGLGPGSRIAGYLIEEQVGAGGMAVVFRARDEVLGRLAAVKVIAPTLADDEEFRARFLRESRAAAAVDSLHIIPVFGAGESEGLLYIATRFVAGGDLAGLLRRCGGRLSPERAASLVAQVASALDAAHAAGLVHRDVKPQNILIDAMPERPEHAYLSDFGLSKGTSSAGLTASGEFLGTPDYCAPEQIRSAGVDGRADQYALGCVAFVLLTGTAPFHRAETVGTLFAHLQDPVPSATGLTPDLPADVDGVIARALAKSPGDRFGRCGEFAAALREALAPAHPDTIVGDQPRLDGDRAPALSGTQPAPERSPALLAPSPAGPPAPPPAAVESPAATGDGSGYADTVTTWNNNRDTPGQGRSRRRGKTVAMWAASGIATLLIAGVAAAVGFHVLPSGPGSAATHPPAHPAASRAPSHPAASHASSQPVAEGSITSRVLTRGNYGFNGPSAIAADGTDIWVANYSGNSLTELKASDGTWIRTLSGGSYGFNGPFSIAADGAHIWVTNYSGNSVTELSASDGTLIRTLSGGSYGFSKPSGIAADGAGIWVANWAADSVTELSASDGTLIRTLSGGSYDFSQPYDVAADGARVWVTDSNWVTELSAGDGTLIRSLKDGAYQFNSPDGIAVDGAHIWVNNYDGDSVTELSVSDGAWIRTLSGGGYDFSSPWGIAADGAHVWVANYGGNSVTELSASDGTWIRTLSGGSFRFNGPVGIAADGGHIWITNSNVGADSVTDLTAESPAGP